MLPFLHVNIVLNSRTCVSADFERVERQQSHRAELLSVILSLFEIVCGILDFKAENFERTVA